MTAEWRVVLIKFKAQYAVQKRRRRKEKKQQRTKSISQVKHFLSTNDTNPPPAFLLQR